MLINPKINPKANPKVFSGFGENNGLSGHLLGRQQSAPEDYKRLARWLHRHHRELNSAVQAVVNTAVAITGITSGIALYLLIIN